MSSDDPYHIDAVVGALLLAFIAYGKANQFRFRRRAVAVTATVAKVLNHPRVTSHFVRYSLEGKERGAEFRTSAFRRTFGPGDTVQILIDPTDPPDDAIPEGSGSKEVALGGSCVLAGEASMSFWEFLYIAGALSLIYFSFR